MTLLANVYSPIVVTELGISKDVIARHPEKKPFGKVVILPLLGIVQETKELSYANTYVPSDVKVFGNWIDTRDLQSAKA